MSIADKQLFIDTVATKLSDKLTVTQIIEVQAALQTIASDYEIMAVARPAIQNDFVEAFLAAKEIEGCSVKTIKLYRYLARRLLKFANIPIEQVNTYHIRQYLIREKQRGISDATLKNIRETYSSFFGWLHKEGLIQRNPIANIGPIKCEKKIRKPYSDIDLEKLKECCGNDRNRAIFFLLLSTGCRISEVCALNRSDINVNSLECVVHGKGNKQRTVFFSDVAAMMLKRYLDGRKDDDPALFVGKRHNRLTDNGIRCMLKVVSRKANVSNVHPHRFRRTLATTLIDRGMPVQDVAFILGHEKLDTTMKYVYIAQDNVKNAYRKYA